MSIATITTFGFGTYGTVNSAVVLGYLSGIVPPPPPAADVSVPGPADKRKRDREEYYKKRKLSRQKKARELAAKQPQRRLEPVQVLQHEPSVHYGEPQVHLFKAVAAPVILPPTVAPEPPLPAPKVFNDDEEIFLLTE